VLALLVLINPLSAANRVDIEFVDPVHYTDVGPYKYRLDHGPLPAIERHLQKQGADCLAAGDRLQIRFLDIDLAGRLEWWRGAAYQDLRVMRDVTWPRMRLAYRWLDGAGRLRQQDEVRLSDMNYLTHSRYLTAGDEPYGYDKAMLTRWFRQQFCR
jgi:hypothetical protein